MVEQFSKLDKFSQKREMLLFCSHCLPFVPLSITWRSLKWLSNSTHSTWWYVSPLATRRAIKSQASIDDKWRYVWEGITPHGKFGKFSHMLPSKAHACSHCTLSSLIKLFEDRLVCCHLLRLILGSSESSVIFFSKNSTPSDKYLTVSALLLQEVSFCWPRASPR